MGYTGGSLIDAFPDFIGEASDRIAERVGDELKEEVSYRTPVAEIPLAYLADRKAGGRSGWIKDRKGRQPGTLKESWIVTPVEHRGELVTVSVETEDPVALFVEHDTRPHLIRAKHLTPKGNPGYLRFPQGAQFIFRHQVQHPGTSGVHMMRDSLAELEVRWPQIAEEVLEEIAAEQARVA